MDKKKIIIVAVALIAIIVILAGAAAALLMGGDNYDAKISSGYRYLEEGDFNSALLMFQEALDMDGTQEDAYVGMYNAYVGMRRYSDALQIARRGLSATNSAQLTNIVRDLEAYTSSLQNAKPGTPSQSTNAEKNEIVTEDKDVTPVLNEELLSLFGAATFGDYGSQYGSPASTVTDNRYYVRLASLPATLIYYDTATAHVIDQSKGLPYNTYMPNEIELDNVMSLFGGGNAISYMTLKNLTGVLNPTKDGTTVKFTYGKCEVTIICDENDMITANSKNTIIPTGDAASAQKNTLRLTILDATNGSAVMGAKVKAYAGYGISGTAVEGTTGSDGSLTLELEQNGTYTLQISKDGYIEETLQEYILAGDNYKSLTISPEMSGDAIRFVLSWGATPTDLDSYLFGTSSDGTRIRVCYLDKQKIDTKGNTIAELDVDDTTGFGPETITLYDTAGSYEFVVADYLTTGTMAYSGAQVKIYVGSTLYTTVDIAAGIENQWHVCEIVNGQITVTNRAADLSSSGGNK